MPKVYGVNLSPFVRKLRVALAEKNIAYDLEPVMPFGMSDELKAKNPAAKIPIWEEEDGFAVGDSSVIIAYLEKTHPNPSLLPSDPHSYARALFYEEYGDTLVANVATVPFVERVVNATFMNKPADEERVADAMKNQAPPIFDHLESQLGSGDGIVDGRFSLADIAICSPLINMAHAKETVDASRWPKLAAYVEKTWSRPSFKALIEEEKAGLPG